MIPSIWTSIYDDLPLHEALRALAAVGWRAFEVSTEHLVAIETAPDSDGMIGQACDCLRDLKLSVMQAHGWLGADVGHPDAARRERDIQRLIRHIGIAARLGATCVVVHPASPRGLTAEDRAGARRLNQEAFRRLGEIAGGHGVRIALENLMRPGTVTPAEILDLMSAIDCPGLGVVYDTSHANKCALDVAGCIREYGSHLIGTHISDNDRSSDQHLVPGGGTIDWPAVMKALGDIGYTGVLNLEIPGERHRVRALRDLKVRHAFGVTQWLIGMGRPA